MAENIYFDESGFTGNNLLHPQQGIFSYASVHTDDDEAKSFVEYAIKKYGVQGGELKGKNLIKYNKGKNLISEILSVFKGRLKASVSNKKYALAGKFFEYIFEPALSDNNLLFYNLNFHKFVSNVLYMEFVARGAGAEEIFEDFESLMRTGDFDRLTTLFSSTSHPDMSPILSSVKDFAILNQASVREELNGYAGHGAGKWVLDLTNTALFSLLAEWGLVHDQVTAFCDSSKPLMEDQSLYDAMINREDRHFTEVAGFRSPLTFNLSGPLRLVNSKEVHGIQIADAVAAAFAYCTDSSNKDAHANEWRKQIEDVLIYGSVFPDMSFVDLDRLEVKRNALILMELLERSRDNINLVAGMPEHVAMLTHYLAREALST